MKKAALLICFFFYSIISFSQYWQQRVDYLIDVSLDDSEKTLDAFEKISYTNNSPDTLHLSGFIYGLMLIKPIKQLLATRCWELGDTRFYFSTKDQKGYINHLDFKVDGLRADNRRPSNLYRYY